MTFRELVRFAHSCAATLLLAVISSPVYSAPGIEWEHSQLSIDIEQGGSRTVATSFVSGKRLDNVAVRVVPELERFIQILPNEFETIGRGDIAALVLDIAVAPDTPVGSLNGTIQIRQIGENNRTYSKPLQVTLNVTRPRFINQNPNYTVTHPPGADVTDWSAKADPNGFVRDSTFFLVIPDDLDGVAVNTLSVPTDIFLESLSETLFETSRTERQEGEITWQVVEHADFDLSHQFISAFTIVQGRTFQITTVKGPQRLLDLFDELLTSFEIIE